MRKLTWAALGLLCTVGSARGDVKTSFAPGVEISINGKTVAMVWPRGQVRVTAPKLQHRADGTILLQIAKGELRLSADSMQYHDDVVVMTGHVCIAVQPEREAAISLVTAQSASVRTDYK